MRISGITIPDNKTLEIGLTAVFGVGRPYAKAILEKVGVSKDKKPSDLTTDQENEIRKIVEESKIEGNLKREISANVKRLVDIGAYRGTRHYKRLPARGQRTKTNSRTIRGNMRKTMGSGRKKVDKK